MAFVLALFLLCVHVVVAQPDPTDPLTWQHYIQSELAIMGAKTTHPALRHAFVTRDAGYLVPFVGGAHNVTQALNSGIQLLLAEVHDYEGMFVVFNETDLTVSGTPRQRLRHRLRLWHGQRRAAPCRLVAAVVVHSDRPSLLGCGWLCRVGGARRRCTRRRTRNG